MCSRAQEAERRRIARELHDETAQTLTSLLVGLKAVEESQDLGQALGAASTLRGLVSAALLGVQRMARGLRPSVLDDLGLEEALERLGLEVSRANGFVVDLHSTGPRLPRLPEAVETALYRMAQEALDERDQARLAQGREHPHPSKPDRGALGGRGRRKGLRRLGDPLRGAAWPGGDARTRSSRGRFDDRGIVNRKRYDHLCQRPAFGTEAGFVMKVRVFIADNHGILRGGLRALINLQPDMEVVGEAANGPDTESGVKATEPDVVLMDISMPNGGGLAAITAVKQVRPKTRIIVLTVHDELGYVRAAGQAGAVGYVVKSAVDTELLAAIRAVAQGRTFMDASLGLGFGQNSMRPNSTDAQGGAATAQLTARELEVMRRVAEGFTNSQIAEELRLGVKSVETYRSRVMEKLGLASRSALVRFALDCGVLDAGHTIPMTRPSSWRPRTQNRPAGRAPGVIHQIAQHADDVSAHVVDAQKSLAAWGARARRFTRNNPGTVLIGAVVLGFVLARAARHA